MPKLLRGIPNLKIILFVLTFSLFIIHFSLVVRADCAQANNAESFQCQIDQIQRDIDQIKPAHDKNKAELASLRAKISSLNAKISSLSRQLDTVEKNLEDREASLAVRQQLFEEKTKRHYMVLRQQDPLAPFLLADTATDLLQQIAIRSRVIAQDQQDIIKIAQEINDLENDKQTLTKNRSSLQAAQSSLNKNATFLAGEVAKVEKYIQGLTQKQKNLIAAKLASLHLPTSLGAGPLLCTDDRKIDPGFSPGFAFYTYGIPHRVGLNQYGAYGRAKAGQNYRDILNAYYQGVSFDNKGNITISVNGYGNLAMETYLLGIAEMPGDWPLEALKAQAVAARSYAWSYTNGGAKSICTTQACQVYKGSNRGGNWEQAVKATEGEVLSSGGSPITAWYASTFGGYELASADIGWSPTSWTKRMRDTSGDVGSFGDLNSLAYDKDSPCFYAAQGYRKEYNKSAWLKADEVADIVNALKLAKADSGTQSHLSQPDKPDSDTWDQGRVKQELSSRGIAPYNSISSVSVSDWDTSTGKTTSVSVSGDAGSDSFSGDELKTFFNLRAPANIQIVGPLYNIERR
ncbi:MAG: SpoIID/LytB domain-containing protein [Candidatus Blackburnbacteria bacterium]|nr:SpoIID/LytB domain-containing protein [Candidatus Blackburnbacteria bacterium]